MARGFFSEGTGATDAVTSSYSGLDSDTRSYAVRVYAVGLGPSDQGRVFDQVDGCVLRFVPEDLSRLQFIAPFSTQEGQWSFPAPSTTTWGLVVITYDASSTANDPVVEVDGSAVTVTEDLAPIGTRSTPTGAFIIGNRDGGDRVFDGRIAEAAAWMSILSPGDKAAIAAGDSIEGLSPVIYVPLCGVASPEPEYGSGAGAGATVTGALFKDHPPGLTSPCTPPGWPTGSKFLPLRKVA